MADTPDRLIPHYYLNPPRLAEERSRPLSPGTFAELQSQLGTAEILIALFYNQDGALVATWLDVDARLQGVRQVWGEPRYRALEFSVGPRSTVPVSHGGIVLDH